MTKRERERITAAEKCATGGSGQQKRAKTGKERKTDGWLVGIDGFFIGAVLFQLRILTGTATNKTVND